MGILNHPIIQGVLLGLVVAGRAVRRPRVVAVLVAAGTIWWLLSGLPDELDD